MRVFELDFGGPLVSLMEAALASLALGSPWQHLPTLGPTEVTEATARPWCPEGPLVLDMGLVP